MSVSFEFLVSQGTAARNLAINAGLDEASTVWSEDPAERRELARLLTHARPDAVLGAKSLRGVDLRGEEPFMIKSALLEDLDLQGLKLPAGTDLSSATFIGCNVIDMNFEECVTQ